MAVSRGLNLKAGSALTFLGLELPLGAGTRPETRQSPRELPMKEMWEEFKTFAMKGNVIDLAIGVIIGAAFTPIVATLVANIMMPIIGYVTAGIDFSTLAATPVEGVEIKYGLFINAIIQFTITAIALFFLIKAINMVRTAQGCAALPGRPDL